MIFRYWNRLNTNYLRKGRIGKMKKLYRSRTEKMIFGVCGGIGEYFEVDPTIIRIGVVVSGLFGAGIIAYIICAFIIPEKPVI